VVEVAVGKGKFVLYSRIDPPLKAGDYKVLSRQDLSASTTTGALNPGDLPVDPLETNLRVRSPQYQLPPDQVLSTFPPAGSVGAYGSRLPQIVIRRRTLPWERSVGEGQDEKLPWLALVLIAQGEADLVSNAKVTDCVTPGVELDVPHDVELGNYLKIRQSVVNRVFPTREEVSLLAHARQVDITDTELMMGDDDGFLAVVISNRLPLSGRDENGDEAPVMYLACLVNLCEQFDSLLDKSAEPNVFTDFPVYVAEQSALSLSALDHASMGSPKVNPEVSGISELISKGVVSERTTIHAANVNPDIAAPFEPARGWASQTTARAMSDVYAEMARPFTGTNVSGFIGGDFISLDQELRFPVLLHWSFTSSGDETFRSLVEGLDSGLLGTVGPHPDNTGRPPFEMVETGHVGLAHRTRRGDAVRSWYRGPLVAHPTVDPPEGRLPLAQTADQIRIVVPDGREDISYAAAFEVGRMLALSRPSMVASLMRWRQLGYQTAHLVASFAAEGMLVKELDKLHLRVGREIGGMLGAALAEAIVSRPDELLGNPRPLVDAGRPVLQDVSANTVMAAGLGISGKVFVGTAGTVRGTLHDTPVRLPRSAGIPTGVEGLRSALTPGLDTEFTRTAVQSLAPQIREGHLDVGVLNTLPIDLQTQLGGLAAGVAAVAFPQGRDHLDRLMSARKPPSEDDEEGPR
jgi:hypothetical protein